MADQIRAYARQNYIEPARRRGEKRVTIVAGDIVRALGLVNRTPNVCSALRSKTFLSESNAHLEEVEGPRSGNSTTVKFTYELDEPSKKGASFEDLRGIGKETFARLGGAEHFIKEERKAWGE